MTASLYQSSASSSGVSIARAIRSEVVVEVVLRAHPPAHAQDVRRQHVRVELHVVVRTVPEVARAAEQVVDLEAAATGVDPELAEVELRPPALAVVEVEVADDED